MKEQYRVADLKLAPDGHRKIEWVGRHMPVLNRLAKRLHPDEVFKGKTVAMSIHLEAKTAYLCLVLKDLGVDVWATGSNPFSTKDDVSAALVERGIYVFARHGVNELEHREEILAILSARPEVILDDGADISLVLHDHSEFGARLKGISEETTTGVVRLKKLLAEKRLVYPAITVNDAKSKHLFDNRYGTGQSTWTAVTHLTNLTVAGKTVVIVGYGWVGRGVANIAKGLGALVIITELDPWKALEAHMDGFQVMPIEDACRVGHIFVTATGAEGALRTEHFQEMVNGAIIGNAGHSTQEIDVRGLISMTRSVREAREGVFEYNLKNGHTLYLLVNGNIVNIAGGFGHPAEIMDMSFSLQLMCLHYLLRSEKLQPGVYPVPREIDELVVREKLIAEGIKIDASL